MLEHRAYPQGGYHHGPRGRRKTLKLRNATGEVLNWIEKSYSTSEGVSRRKWKRRVSRALKVT